MKKYLIGVVFFLSFIGCSGVSLNSLNPFSKKSAQSVVIEDIKAADVQNELSQKDNVYEYGKYYEKNGRYFLTDTNEPVSGTITAYYQDTSSLAYAKEVNKGYLNGRHIAFFKDGSLVERSNWYNGARDGFGVFYDKKAQVFISERYEKGVYKKGSSRILDKDKKPYSGTYEQYYPNGKLKTKFNVKDGITDGTYFIYYENGNVQKEVFYKNGMIEGAYKSFYENGAIASEREYKDGYAIAMKYFKEDGSSHTKHAKAYYSNGNLRYENLINQNGNTTYFLSNYVTGKKAEEISMDGSKIIVKFWNSDGELIYEAHYENSELVYKK